MGIILYTFYAKWSMETQWYIHLQRVDQLYFVFSSYIRNGMHYSLGVCLSIIPSAPIIRLYVGVGNASLYNYLLSITQQQPTSTLSITNKVTVQILYNSWMFTDFPVSYFMVKRVPEFVIKKCYIFLKPFSFVVLSRDFIMGFNQLLEYSCFTSWEELSAVSAEIWYGAVSLYFGVSQSSANVFYNYWAVRVFSSTFSSVS